MSVRPDLSPSLTGAELRRWYWLKAELMAFARKVGVSAGGGKAERTERLAATLDGGAAPAPAPRAPKAGPQLREPLTLDSVIPRGQRCSQVLRRFLTEHAGSGFRFDEPMRRFVAEGEGRSLREAVAHWHATRDAGPREIGAQFELNRFVRAWHAAHPGGAHAEALAAWRRHRSLPVDRRR